MEELFNDELWVGDFLTFIPLLAKLDNEKDRGSINFDDLLLQHEEHRISWNPVPSDYEGYDWVNFAVVDTNRHPHKISRSCAERLKNALVSPDNVIINIEGAPASISSPSGNAFNFVSAHITAVCLSPQQMRVTGFRDHVQVYSANLVLSEKPLFFAPHWKECDRVEFASYLPGNVNGETTFALDSVSLSALSSSRYGIGTVKRVNGESGCDKKRNDINGAYCIFNITLDSPSFTVGQMVYVSGAGYFQIVKESGSTFSLKLANKGPGDSGYIETGVKVVPSAISGMNGKKRGEKRVEETAFLLPEFLSNSSFFSQLPIEMHPFAHVSVQMTRKAFPSLNNRKSSHTPLELTATCPTGSRVKEGRCEWKVMKAQTSSSWCRPHDFSLGKRGCNDCISSIKTHNKDINGKREKVVTQVAFKKGEEVKRVNFNEESCVLVEPKELDEAAMKECGFFCFFHNFLPSRNSDFEFSCTYVPPSFFGLDDFLAAAKKDSHQALAGKIQALYVNIICEEF